MGCNYYLYEPDGKDIVRCMDCGHLGPAMTKRHLGKRSCGWRFSFHGEKDGFPSSWDDIKTLLFSDPASFVLDEYGDFLTKEDFIERVESTRSVELNHCTYMAEHHPDSMGSEWMDREGWSFSSHEFS